jgi:hypothetical protein
MTQLTTPTKAPSPPPAPTVRLSDILLHVIASILAPIFLGVTGGDVGLARVAAIETVNVYRAHNCADLIAVAQIVAYGLAALSSLSLSLDDELSLSMILRLRGNANALNRSAEQNRRAIRINAQPQDADVMVQPEPAAMPETYDDAPEAEPFLNEAAAELLAAESRNRLPGPQPKAAAEPVARAATAVAATAPDATEKRHREMWAIAMVKEASEITAGIPGMPPAERGAATIRAGMLASTANQLLTGGDVPDVAFRLTPGKLTGSRVRSE